MDSDEYTLTDIGFTNEGVNNGTAYAQNSAHFLTGATAGARICIDSGNIGLTGESLRSALAAYKVSYTVPRSLPRPMVRV